MVSWNARRVSRLGHTWTAGATCGLWRRPLCGAGHSIGHSTAREEFERPAINAPFSILRFETMHAEEKSRKKKRKHQKEPNNPGKY